MAKEARKVSPATVVAMPAPSPSDAARSNESAPRRNNVVAQIRELIRDLGLQPGARLPSERKLAEQFGVGRGTVREAMQLLKALELVEIRRGGGCFVRVAASSPERVRSQWVQWVGRHRGHVLEIIEFRQGCEAFAAELAARRAGPEDLAHLVEALRTMKAASLAHDATAFMQSDLAFHDALLRATGNKTLQEVVSALGRELIPERAAIVDVIGRSARSLLEHSAIYAAVQAGDGSGAARAMRDHLESVKHDMLVHLIDANDGASGAGTEPVLDPKRDQPLSTRRR